MLKRCIIILFTLIMFQLVSVARSDSLLEKRDNLINRLEALNAFSRENITAAEAEIMKQLINTDQELIKDLLHTRKKYNGASQRLESIQQEKQIYLAQNIQLSTELEELKNEQLMLYIIAGFLLLLFIGLFIIFFVQLKKINDLAVEGQDLYNINESIRFTLTKYEKRYYHMKEEHEMISSDLNKLRETTAKTEKDYALIEEKLNNEKRKNELLSQKLNQLNNS